ncbi:MAG: YfhO family protein, partial [Chitinophagaceae bacterium]|nr:YfhO family protein [Chitinophagaceae bacterium]
TASIKLQQYRNNDISYAVTTAGKPQFAVLSEIYYSRGWNAYADGKQVPIVKTNYVLRGVALPAGTQKLELKFEPESYKMGSSITTITSAIVLVLLLLGLYMQYFRKRSES